MAFVPMVFRDFWNDDFIRPSRLIDQHFGVGVFPDDIFEPSSITPPRVLVRGQNYYRPWRSANASRDTGSTVFSDREKFQVALDVKQFGPAEVTVKMVDDSIVVEGKHEEKEDEHGYITRHFVRRYVLPNGHRPDDVVSSLSSDGILTIIAPKELSAEALAERVVPIVQTGPAKLAAAGEKKTEEQ